MATAFDIWVPAEGFRALEAGCVGYNAKILLENVHGLEKKPSTHQLPVPVRSYLQQRWRPARAAGAAQAFCLDGHCPMSACACVLFYWTALWR